MPEACETLNTEYNVVVAADPRCPSDACTFDATIYVNPDLTVPEQVEAVSKEWAKILNYCANGGDAPAGTNDFLWQQWIKGEAAYMKYLYEDATVCAK